MYVSKLHPFNFLCFHLTEKIERTVQIEASTVEIEERGVKLRLTVVDTPGYGDAINSQDWCVSEPLHALFLLIMCSLSKDSLFPTSPPTGFNMSEFLMCVRVCGCSCCGSNVVPSVFVHPVNHLLLQVKAAKNDLVIVHA